MMQLICNAVLDALERLLITKRREDYFDFARTMTALMAVRSTAAS